MTDEIRSATVPWVLFTVGLAAQVVFALLNGHFGYVGDTSGVYTKASGYSQYFALASDCVPLAVAAAAIRCYQAPTAGAPGHTHDPVYRRNRHRSTDGR